jgi:DNA-binding NarL/FixJ family response regulator
MRVLMIDDDIATMEGASTWLKKRAEKLGKSIDVVFARNCEEAMAMEGRGDVDLVLLDFHLNKAPQSPEQLTGIEGLRAIKDVFPSSPVSIRSGETDRRLIMETISAGAAGFIPKSFNEEETVSAVECVLQTGGIYLPMEALDGANPYPARMSPADQERRKEILDALTPKQLKVLQLVAQGLANKQIAFKVNLSEQTIKAHLSEAFRVLKVSNRVEAVIEAGKLQMFLDD